jgi:hypothetical protein
MDTNLSKSELKSKLNYYLYEDEGRIRMEEEADSQPSIS